jgi:hypothetical protein
MKPKFWSNPLAADADEPSIAWGSSVLELILSSELLNSVGMRPLLKAENHCGIVHGVVRCLRSRVLLVLLAFAMADYAPAVEPVLPGVNAATGGISDGVIDEPATEGPRAHALVLHFLSAYDRSESDEAWGLMSPQTQAMLPLVKWRDDRTAFLQTAGEPLAHDIDKVTWYRNPPSAVQPGLYVTFKLRCQYALLQMCAEAVVLYSEKEGSPLTVLRHDRYSIERAAVQKLCLSHDLADVNFGDGGIIRIQCPPK